MIVLRRARLIRYLSSKKKPPYAPGRSFGNKLFSKAAAAKRTAAFLQKPIPAFYLIVFSCELQSSFFIAMKINIAYRVMHKRVASGNPFHFDIHMPNHSPAMA